MAYRMEREFQKRMAREAIERLKAEFSGDRLEMDGKRAYIGGQCYGMVPMMEGWPAVHRPAPSRISDNGSNAYTLRCALTNESQTVIVCDQHANDMPKVDGFLVVARVLQEEASCEFCRQNAKRETK